MAFNEKAARMQFKMFSLKYIYQEKAYHTSIILPHKNIPVILGEYGALKRTLLTEAEQSAHEASRLYYLEYVTERARDYGLVPFYWDNGASSSRIFNRNNFIVTDQQTLNALMNGATK